MAKTCNSTPAIMYFSVLMWICTSLGIAMCRFVNRITESHSTKLKIFVEKNVMYKKICTYQLVSNNPNSLSVGGVNNKRRLKRRMLRIPFYAYQSFSFHWLLSEIKSEIPTLFTRKHSQAVNKPKTGVLFTFFVCI